ncbi:hypothetical protein HCJ39_01220 [Listeria rocourtiae]|uniref:DUF6884 domain-containing protein n=1 Tax=Listeria rocourtiae TaxID=647910 RepID=UPI001628565F|nr:DUF6884 domain-containing protein [Listeria rocourtiae]MBC1603348.1 hypothetical protein [Listeria rocourtiae]
MIIIPSGKPKIWDRHQGIGPVPAKEAYTGTFHRLCRVYAEKFDGEYLILSPKYGFLAPDSIVPGTYDVRFTARGVTANTVSIEELTEQWQALNIKEEPIVMLGGTKFRPLLEDVSDRRNQFIFPLHGTRGIGEMQKRLRTAIDTGEPLG